jgi:penicillin-binding protein 1C
MKVKKRKRRWLRWPLSLIGTAAAGVALFHSAVAWLPNAPERVGRPQAGATILLDRDGRELAALAAVDGQFHLPLTSEEAGLWLAKAVVAVEDARFEEHAGVDWKSVSAAVWEDVSTLSVRRGASTIPMQVVRLRDPQPRSLSAKVMQAVRATQLIQRTDRASVLNEYLNRAPFGGNLIGAAAASWRYFGKPCHKLTLAEAATLAGLPQSPNRFRPDRFPAKAVERRDHVLNRMLACGMITAEQHAEALAEPLIATWRPLPQHLPAAPAATAMASLAHLTTGRPGGKVTTTIDPTLQKTAGDLAKLHLASLPTSTEPLGVAVVVLDTLTGECLAAVNAGPAAGQLDLTHRRRSTGSVLKPFIYALAFDEGLCTPDTLLTDGPLNWAGYQPRNFDREFRGQMPAGEALAQSRNIPAMDLLSRVGVARTGKLLTSIGLQRMDDPDRYGLTLAVGGAEASPYEIAGAFATLARGGQHVSPRMVLERALVRRDRVLSPAACDQTIRALSDPVRTRSVSPAAAMLGVAWKTGTSSDQRDAWCAATTARFTVVTWIGSVASHGNAALVGAEAAAPLALNVLVACDPAAQPDLTPSSSSSPALAAMPSNAARFAITSPQHKQVFMIDSAIAPEAQQIALTTHHSGGDEVFWFVDADPLTVSPDPAGRCWWRPTPGLHTLRAVTARGESSAVQIKVERPK